jgi:hypothetical protein
MIDQEDVPSRVTLCLCDISGVHQKIILVVSSVGGLRVRYSPRKGENKKSPTSQFQERDREKGRDRDEIEAKITTATGARSIFDFC